MGRPKKNTRSGGRGPPVVAEAVGRRENRDDGRAAEAEADSAGDAPPPPPSAEPSGGGDGWKGPPSAAAAAADRDDDDDRNCRSAAAAPRAPSAVASRGDGSRAGASKEDGSEVGTDGGGGGGGGGGRSRRKRARLRRRRARRDGEKRAARRERERSRARAAAGAGAGADEEGRGFGASHASHGATADSAFAEATMTARSDRKRLRSTTTEADEVAEADRDGPPSSSSSSIRRRCGGGDCYEEVLWSDSARSDRGGVVSSWLREVRWIYAGEEATVAKGCRGVGETGRPKERSPAHSPPDDAANRADDAKKDASSSGGERAAPYGCRRSNSGQRGNEIERLHEQLCAIKRRLWPAAVRCAEARSGGRSRIGRVALDDEEEEGESADGVRAKEKDGDADAAAAAREFAAARRACNPFEELGERRNWGLNRTFVNRSAVKLANVDAMLGFSLTGGSSSGDPERNDDGAGRPFLFVDLCGAPGGFSEYVLRRRRRFGGPCRGYGMSLSGTNEHGTGVGWRLDRVAALSWGGGVNFRACGGADGTGDIYHWENVLTLRDEIAAKDALWEGGHAAQGKGGEADRHLHKGAEGLVDLVMADGGFDAQRNSECQEVLARKIVACQAAAALLLLRPNGCFVMKMFGFRTCATRMLVEYLFFRFERIVVLKPVLSRPASAERYLVCHSFRGVEPNWDGLAWRDEMLRECICCHGHSEPSATAAGLSVRRHENCSNLISSYLDEVENDMLGLNVKACSAILSHLETTARDAIGDTVPSGVRLPARCPINIHQYKFAWEIG